MLTIVLIGTLRSYDDDDDDDDDDDKKSEKENIYNLQTLSLYVRYTFGAFAFVRCLLQHNNVK